MPRVVETAIAIDAAGLFGDDVLLSAGGSAFFDLVALGFQSVKLSRPVRRVLRSGCYLTYDEFGYAKEQLRMLRERRVELPEGSLQPALEVWSYVQSATTRAGRNRWRGIGVASCRAPHPCLRAAQSPGSMISMRICRCRPAQRWPSATWSCSASLTHALPSSGGKY